MKIITEEEVRLSVVRHVAENMLTAARTAPKARGVDNLVIALVEKDGIAAISEALKSIAVRNPAAAFLQRDANNILSAQCMVIIGSKYASIGVQPCNLCGFTNCEEKDQNPDYPCVFNTGDLGIAIGSAVSVAADHRIDCRVMFSVGAAVKEIKLLREAVRIAYGIPLSVSSKNPFFDRK
jgi:uncharacterized ferredoxin-like protein